jgi:hypothetical protein
LILLINFLQFEFYSKRVLSNSGPHKKAYFLNSQSLPVNFVLTPKRLSFRLRLLRNARMDEVLQHHVAFGDTWSFAY